MTEQIWKSRPVDPKRARDLAGSSGLSEPVAATLLLRGYADPESIDAFLRPRLSRLHDPFTLPDMDRAVARIFKALDEKQVIVVYGDYDVDGITSTALLETVLRELGGQVHHFLPHRIDDGYGLGLDTIERCIDQWKPGLIITVDCGTNSAEAVEHAARKGVDVVITDHHEPGGQTASPVALVNPKRGDDPAAQVLAGVGVSFKLCHALVKRARDEKRSEADIDIKKYLDFVALGTVADMVPLIHENRALARHGMERISRTESMGLRALVDVAGIEGKITAYHIGFILGPRLNAAGRLGTAEAALELLLTGNTARARELATELDRTNRERRDEEARTVEAALAQIEPSFDSGSHFGLIAAGEGWHAGVVGIVSSRITRHFYRPSVVIALDPESGKGRGSCRSIEGFNMLQALDDCADLLLAHGGHQMAAGLEIESDRVEAFRERFNEKARTNLEGQELKPALDIEAWIDLAQLDRKVLDELDQLRPFGSDNPKPVWAAAHVTVAGRPRVVGRKHLKFTVASGGTQLDAIAFGCGERGLADGPIDLAFCPEINSFRGRESIQLNVRDYRPAQSV